MKSVKLNMKDFRLDKDALDIFNRTRKRILNSNTNFRPRVGIIKKIE